MRPEENFTENNDAYLRIPLSGPKGRGSLFFHASCHDNQCHVQRLEFEVIKTKALEPEDYENKRLVVFDINKHGPIDQ